MIIVLYFHNIRIMHQQFIEVPDQHYEVPSQHCEVPDQHYEVTYDDEVHYDNL